MGSAKGRQSYIVTLSLIGWAHTQKAPCPHLKSSAFHQNCSYDLVYEWVQFSENCNASNISCINGFNHFSLHTHTHIHIFNSRVNSPLSKCWSIILRSCVFCSGLFLYWFASARPSTSCNGRVQCGLFAFWKGYINFSICFNSHLNIT